MRFATAAALLAVVLPAWAQSTVACFQDCARQGYERSQCLTLCERTSGGPGLIQQPGLPRNPYLDALPDPVPKRQALPPPRLDPRCMDDCKGRGYQYGYCRKQCSY